ncbi:MAG TPA: beta-propeller fold lactonase family protein [Solirubrobacterales bacterium]|nr:beta-propeller fold lactonase family protein [Solirubrobacterales bacterium]
MHRQGSLLAAASLFALLAFCALAQAARAAPFAYVGNLESADVSAFSVDADGGLAALAGSPFAAGEEPFGLAVTPDGTHLYVANEGSEAVSGYEIGAAGGLTPLPGSPYPAGVQPYGVAITPDGSHLYVANQGDDTVSAYEIAADGALVAAPGSPFPTGHAPFGVAVTPDGTHLYVTNEGSSNVSAYAIGADGGLAQLAGSPYPVGSFPLAASVTPDGRHLYVSGGTADLWGFSIGEAGGLSELAGSPFPTGSDPFDIAITSDGRRLYLGNQSSAGISGYAVGAEGELSPLPGTPYAAGSNPAGLAVAPDGHHLYATSASSDVVSGFSIAGSGALGTVAGSPFAAGTHPEQVTLTPDQGPVAAFTTSVAPAGSVSTFDGSSSSDPDGTVARYEWDFGDGSTVTDGGATPHHTYAAPGTYTVTLTVSDDEGCSTIQTFTGQTVGCNGGPAARVSHQVTVARLARTLAVRKTGGGSGTVTSSPAGIDCGPTCSARFEADTVVTLSATAAPGSTFAGWGGACSGTGICSVTMDRAHDVSAGFTAVKPSPAPPTPPPNTKIIAAKISPRGGGATFRFRALGRATGFQCALTGKGRKARFRPCSSPKRYLHLKPGRYTFGVRATGPGGTDASPAKRRFKVTR